jgi:hypothetical protein
MRFFYCVCLGLTIFSLRPPDLRGDRCEWLFLVTMLTMMDGFTATKLDWDNAGTILIERITPRLNIVILQWGENCSVLMFAFIWDLYWNQDCVSSISTDTYHRSNMQCLLILSKSCIWLHDWLMQLYVAIGSVMHTGCLPASPTVPLTLLMCSGCLPCSLTVPLMFWTYIEY